MCARYAKVLLLSLGVAVHHGEHAPVLAGQEALVLSGGGSRGLVHAGVIDALEERGYDADIVVGTSMGAVVGALYAAGYSPEEILDRIRAVDWTEVFIPAPLVIGPDRAIRYPLVNFDLRIEERRFSRGLIGQWRINRELARLLFDANARIGGDFDRLPRRFRAVAADLRTGEIVALDRGDLARATRASMAVPGIFAPVVWNGRTLVDGGITDNLPTTIARRLGATHVIAVEVSRPPPEIEDGSPLGVIRRAIDLMQENLRRDSIPPDLLIIPETGSFLGTVFPEDPEPLFRIGRASVLTGPHPFHAKEPPSARQLPPAPDMIDRLVIEAADSSLSAFARESLERAASGPYDPTAILAAVDRLYTTGLFEGIWPRVVRDSSGATLLVRLESPPRLSLSASAAYDNDRGALAWLSFDRHGSIRRRPLISNLSASTTGLDRWIALSTTAHPHDRTFPAASFGLYARERDVRFFLEDGGGPTDVVRIGGWSALEFPHVLRDRLASLVLYAERVRVENGARGYSFGPLIRFTNLNPDVLIVGQPFLVEAEHRWGVPEYSRIAARVSRVLGTRPIKIAPFIDLAWTTDDAPPDVQPALGDDHAIPGLRWGERRAASRAILGIDSSLAVGLIHLRLRLRTGTAHEEFWSDAAEWITGSQLAAVWRAAIWSAEVGFGANTAGGRRVEIAVGRQF